MVYLFFNFLYFLNFYLSYICFKHQENRITMCVSQTQQACAVHPYLLTGHIALMSLSLPLYRAVGDDQIV